MMGLLSGKWIPLVPVFMGLLMFSACSSEPQSVQTIDVNTLINEGRLTEAFAKINEQLVHYPRDPNLLYNLAIIQRQQGKISEARRSLEKAQYQAPRDDTLNLLLAELMLETGDVQSAWDTFIKVSESSRNSARGQFIRGIIHAGWAMLSRRRKLFVPPSRWDMKLQPPCPRWHLSCRNRRKLMKHGSC
ncbi:MAG: tetratricopeptide repeat protein [bacterium]